MTLPWCHCQGSVSSTTYEWASSCEWFFCEGSRPFVSFHSQVNFFFETGPQLADRVLVSLMFRQFRNDLPEGLCREEESETLAKWRILPAWRLTSDKYTVYEQKRERSLSVARCSHVCWAWTGLWQFHRQNVMLATENAFFVFTTSIGQKQQVPGILWKQRAESGAVVSCTNPVGPYCPITVAVVSWWQ